MQCERRCTADMTALCETGEQRSLLPNDIDLEVRFRGRGIATMIISTPTIEPSPQKLNALPVLLKKTRETYSRPCIVFFRGPSLPTEKTRRVARLECVGEKGYLDRGGMNGMTMRPRCSPGPHLNGRVSTCRPRNRKVTGQPALHRLHRTTRS
jgi:hypothetical protein